MDKIDQIDNFATRQEAGPGHWVDEAWALIWKMVNGPHQPNGMLGVVRDGLEHRRQVRSGFTLPMADLRAVASIETERKPVVADVRRTHPVHDPSWYVFGERRLWIPWAQDALSGAKRGKYVGGYPAGMVVHWTAGHRNGLTAGNQLMRTTGMLYLLGDAEGNLAQSDPLSHWGYHAGPSSYPGLNGTVSDELVGLEMQAWGKLERKGQRFVGWAGHVVQAKEVVLTEKRGNIEAGHYHRFTEPQMELVRRTACWLFLNYPARFSLDRVLGHDEVSPGRKCDPGGALVHEGKVLTMPQFRELLKEDVARIKAAAPRRG